MAKCGGKIRTKEERIKNNSNSNTRYLTKREYFAGLAMQGLISSPNLNTLQGLEIAENSVKLADALLKALEQTQNKDNQEG